MDITFYSRLLRHIYDFSVYYVSIDVDNIKDINIYINIYKCQKYLPPTTYPPMPLRQNRRPDSRHVLYSITFEKFHYSNISK